MTRGVNNYRIYALFSIATAVITNYYLLRLLFADPGSFFILELFKPVFWIHTFLWVFYAFCISHGLISSARTANYIFSFSFFIMFFLSLVIFDRIVVGPLTASSSLSTVSQDGFIFPPLSKARYKTEEYDFSPEINSLGIRDNDYPIQSDRQYRIMAIGDSFTYGWGVSLADAWAKVLEKRLQAKDLDVEVLNFGQGGAFTSNYKTYAKKAIPILRPNLVIVGLLQGDDLAQLIEDENRFKNRSTLAVGISRLKSLSLKSVTKKAFKNTLHFMETKGVFDIHDEWLNASKNIINNMPEYPGIRYMTFSPEVRRLFESGNLNPALISYGLYFPDRNSIANDPDNPETKSAIIRMRNDLREIKQICIENKAELLIVNIPCAPFVNHAAVHYADMGFFLSEHLLQNNRIDSIYQNIARDINAKYLQLTNVFMNESKNHDLYFHYDGHMNKQGHLLLAEEIDKYLVRSYFNNN
ncbi:MAG: SGNH/GDSL hydrolase family protein [Thermodesulfovibrionales bacterium]